MKLMHLKLFNAFRSSRHPKMFENLQMLGHLTILQKKYGSYNRLNDYIYVKISKML